MHCSGVFGAGTWETVDHAALRAHRHACAADVCTLYEGLSLAGVQYGPGYRTLMQAFGGVDALARLRARSTQAGTRVHPADLDDALCVSALVPSRSEGGGETRLPFAVDAALLNGAPGELWAVRRARHDPNTLCDSPSSTRVCVCLWSQGVHRTSADAVSLRLGSVAGPAQAQLDGFKSRALRTATPTQRHLYVTAWRATDVVGSPEAEMLVIGDGVTVVSERLSARVARHGAAFTFGSDGCVVFAAATQRGSFAPLPLLGLHAALVLVQAQLTAAPVSAARLLTSGAQPASPICRSSSSASSGCPVCPHAEMAVLYETTSGAGPDACIPRSSSSASVPWPPRLHA